MGSVAQVASAAAGIELRDVSKRFGGILALDRVSFSIAPGECHALIGENGAGKSTLGKVLAGIHRPDAGEVRLDGRSLRFASPADAARTGIAMVHQELAFCPQLSVAENLCLGRYPTRWGFVLDQPAMRRAATELLERGGGRVDVREPMGRLSTAQQQLVQIAHAVGSGARVLIFDEPTSSLSDAEVRRLFALIGTLRARRVTIIYVSHRLPEVLHLADRITVLRDGRCVGTLDRAAASEEALVRMMIGRALAEVPRRGDRPPGPEVLRVERLSSPGRVSDVSLTLRAGEIVGLAGLVGAGRSELAQAIFGLDPHATGRVWVGARRLHLRNVRAALRCGLGLVPEDRKRQGLVLPLSVRFNFSLAILDRLRRLFWLDQRQERRQARALFERLAVRMAGLDAPVASLSGGNQQKVVLARWLARRLRVLIVDEPTRGVDVGAKAAIHVLLEELADQGLGVLLISSELPELLRVSTRILVMRAGRIVREVPRSAASEETLLAAMAGVGSEHEAPASAAGANGPIRPRSSSE